MAKILNFFSKKKDPSKVTVIARPEFITMDHVGPALYHALQSHIDFSKWKFIQELFHLPVTRMKFVGDDLQTDVQHSGVIAAVVVNSDTYELKFFEVKPLLEDFLKGYK